MLGFRTNTVNTRIHHCALGMSSTNPKVRTLSTPSGLVENDETC